MTDFTLALGHLVFILAPWGFIGLLSFHLKSSFMSTCVMTGALRVATWHGSETI